MPRDDRCATLGIMCACQEHHVRPPISHSLLTNDKTVYLYCTKSTSVGVRSINSDLLLFVRSRLDKLSIPFLVYLFELHILLTLILILLSSPSNRILQYIDSSIQ